MLRGKPVIKVVGYAVAGGKQDRVDYAVRESARKRDRVLEADQWE